MLLTVLPLKKGEKLEIHLESEYPRIVSYRLAGPHGDPEEISEYDAQTIMHNEQFLFCDLKELPDAPATASGETKTRPIKPDGEGWYHAWGTDHWERVVEGHCGYCGCTEIIESTYSYPYCAECKGV